MPRRPVPAVPEPDRVERAGWVLVAVLGGLLLRRLRRRSPRPAPAVPAIPGEVAAPALQVGPALAPGTSRLADGLPAEQHPTQSGRRSEQPSAPPSAVPVGPPVPGRPRLAPVHGGGARHADLASLVTDVALPVGALVVGRAEDADVRLDHPTVSPRHALLQVTPDGHVHVRDLGTVNGVNVDGVPVAQARLHDGNRLDLGEVQLVFHCDPEEDDGGRQGGELGEQPHHREQGRD